MRIHLLLYSISRGLPRHGQRISRTKGDWIGFIQGIHRSFNSWLSLVVIAITDLTVIRAAAAAPRRWKIKPVHGSILDKWPCGFRAPFTLCQSPNQWIYSFHLYFNTYPKRSRKRVPSHRVSFPFNQPRRRAMPSC